MEEDEEAAALIPGLPHHLVLLHILSRFPRHTQLSSFITISKAWYRALLRQPPQLFNPPPFHDLLIFQEDFPLSNHLHPKQFSISLLHRNGHTCRKLPSIPGLPFGVFEWCGLVCLGGTLFVLGGRNPETNERSADVYRLDLSAESWRWKRCSSMGTARLFREEESGCVAIRGRIYVIDSRPQTLEAYDMNTDKWHILPSATTKPKDGWLRIDGMLNFRDEPFAYGWEVCNTRPIFAGPYMDYAAHIYCPETRSWRRLVLPFSQIGPLAVVRDRVYRFAEGIPRIFDASTVTWVPVQEELAASWGHKPIKVEVSRERRSADDNGECAIIYAVDNSGRLWICKMDSNVEDRLAKRKTECSTRCPDMWKLVQAPILLHSQIRNICITA